MAQKEHVDVYTIPPNFAKEGTILSGRLEARNAVEAAVLALLLLQILMAVDISAKGKIYAGIIVILPVTILAVVGVQGVIEVLVCGVIGTIISKAVDAALGRRKAVQASGKPAEMPVQDKTAAN